MTTHLFWNVHFVSVHYFPFLTFFVFLVWGIWILNFLESTFPVMRPVPLNHTFALRNVVRGKTKTSPKELLRMMVLNALGWIFVPLALATLVNLELRLYAKYFPRDTSRDGDKVLVERQFRDFRLVKKVTDPIHATALLKDLANDTTMEFYMGPECRGIQRIEPSHTIKILVTQKLTTNGTIWTEFYDYRKALCLDEPR